MQLNAPQKFTEVLNLHRDDDPGVRPARGLPLAIQTDIVARIEGQQGASLLGSGGELIVVGNAKVAPAQFAATDGIVAAPPQFARQSPVNIFVREDCNAYADHRAL